MSRNFTNQLAYIFANDVELKVHSGAFFYILKVGMIERIRNNRHWETVVPGIDDRQAYSVNTYGTFLNGYIPLSTIVLEGVFPASFPMDQLGAPARLVGMPLNNMAI